MLFTLEALNASEGDCLLLSYGTAAKARLILVDGGPRKTFANALAPRLSELRSALGIGDRAPLPIELLVVTHIDDDHIGGVLALFEELDSARTDKRPQIVKIEELWHNSFEGVVGKDVVAEAIAHVNDLPVTPAPGRGTVASVAQGQKLFHAAQLFGAAINLGFEGLVARPDDAGAVVDCKDGLTLTVIGPARKQLEDYKKKWDAELREVKKTGGRVAAADLDTKAFNLASIAVLAKMGNRTILLTGDARGGHLIEGLEAAGVLSPGQQTKVDVLKAAHHGSVANEPGKLFERVIADTYVFSANGTDGNPDRETMESLSRARKGESFKVVCTFPERAYALVKGTDAAGSERREALKSFDEWAHKQVGATVEYRDPKRYGVKVVLGDEDLG